MHLARFPRRRYTQGPTPIEFLGNLTDELGGPKIFGKRDDLLGLAGGGNKTRKLEFVVADALAQGSDTLITCGAVQSNHCRLTLAAAVKEGLRCRLVLEQRVPNSYDPGASGNNFLYRLLGVEKITVVDGGADLAAAMQAEADDLAAEGRRGYVIPGGASTPLGALGYVSCAEEILTQTFDMGLEIHHLVTPTGSGGTHAGLLVGMAGNNSGIPLLGVSVRRPEQEQIDLVHGLALEVGELLELAHLTPRDAVRVNDEHVGEGYSLPTEGMIEAVGMMARLEGILMDPVYSGKAAAGLIDLVRKGAFEADDNVLFLHTGGSPALYAYQDVLLDD
ncbi:D-cysteine desulfhydrase [Gemmatimonadota bacterium]